MRRSGLFLTLVLALALLVNVPVWAGQEIVILHTNDAHGRLESHTPRDAQNEQGGIARLAYMVEQMRTRHGEKVLLLDAGDVLHGTNVLNLFGGIPAVEIMNAMGYDAMTFGNHDFNYGQAILKDRMEDAAFPMLAANIINEDGTTFAYSAYIKEVNGLRVGIIGLSAQDTPIVTHPANVVGLNFHDPVVVGSQLAKRMRADVDVLIALTHVGYGVDQRLAEAAPELDVIVGGHSHTVLDRGTNVGNVLIAHAGEYGNNLGVVRVSVENGVVAERAAHLIPINHEIPKEPKVQSIIDGWNRLLEDRLGESIGSVSTTLDGERENVRTKETNLGNIVADVMRKAAGADVAFANGGGIRASMNAGNVTVGDVYTVLPFDNTLVVLEVTGKTIWDALEFSVRMYPAQNGGFLQVSGLSFDFDQDATEGERVQNVLVRGIPLRENALYSVATNDFMAAGGDGYSMFVGAKLVAETGLMLRDVMVEYFQEQGAVTPPVSGRITVR